MTVLEQRLMESATKYFTTQNNKHIDWEQRRYEISKDILSAICSAPGNCQGQSWPYDNARVSVNVADALIAELQKK